jgi:short-subunit dehydrogenase
MKANFWSAVHTTLAVLPGMKQRGSGRIVNISSIGGKIAVPHLLPYSASKFALTGFSQGLRAELQKHGILVTTVIPGLMRTGSPRHIETIGQHQKGYSWFILSDSIPGLSMDAIRAARKIVAACVAGTGELVLGVPAKVAVVMEAVAPNAVATILAAGNRYVLPGSGNGTEKKKGFQSENFFTRSILTALTRAAEARANQI